MKKALFIACYLLCISYSFSQTLKGKVTDKITGETLVGAIVYFPDLEIGATTNATGDYFLSNLPKGRFLVQVKFTGYAGQTEFIDLAVTTEKDFVLEPSATEIQEVVITGSAFLSDPKRTSVSLDQIDKKELRSIPSSNIVNALATLPGVSEISTGPGISKPVIRGLGYNRVVVLSEGVRQEGQQWGDEHGLEIDQYGVDRIEILKGPGSLLYGSDAMGGVINILEPHSAEQGSIGGEVSSDYSLNNHLTSNSVMIEGNIKGISLRARGTYKSAAAFKNPDEYVYNSGFSETNYSGMLGINKGWGFTHIHFSRFDSDLGLVEGERDSLSNSFINAEGERVPDKTVEGRKLDLPFQNVTHNKVTAVNNFIIGKNQLKVNLGYQTNERREFEDSSVDPALFFHLTTMTYDAKFHLPVKNEIESVIGFAGMTQENENRGEEFLVPDYQLQDLGTFIYAKKSFEKLTLNAGFRYDIRQIDSPQLILDSLGEKASLGDTLFQGFNTDFSAFSGAAGLTYEFNKTYNLKLNVGQGWRAPNIAELGSNGVHEGTFRYEIGNSGLKAETSMQAESEIAAEGKYLNCALNFFYNRINNYIYLRNFNGETIFAEEDTFQVYRYVQGNSELKGLEASLDIHPLESIHFENSISYVEGINLETKNPLPFIPAVRLKNEIKWSINTSNKKLVNTYLRLGMSNYFDQDKIDEFETETEGYMLLNAGVGTEIKMKRQLITVYISADNLMDKKYFNHLSRLKNVGILNAGRNITFGINATF